MSDGSGVVGKTRDVKDRPAFTLDAGHVDSKHRIGMKVRRRTATAPAKSSDSSSTAATARSRTRSSASVAPPGLTKSRVVVP